MLEPREGDSTYVGSLFGLGYDSGRISNHGMNSRVLRPSQGPNSFVSVDGVVALLTRSLEGSGLDLDAASKEAYWSIAYNASQIRDLETEVPRILGYITDDFGRNPSNLVLATELFAFQETPPYRPTRVYNAARLNNHLNNHLNQDPPADDQYTNWLVTIHIATVQEALDCLDHFSRFRTANRKDKSSWNESDRRHLKDYLKENLSPIERLRNRLGTNTNKSQQ